jgi:hypothetical protein
MQAPYHKTGIFVLYRIAVIYGKHGFFSKLQITFLYNTAVFNSFLYHTLNEWVHL